MNERLYFVLAVAPIAAAIFFVSWKNRAKWLILTLYILIYIPFSLAGKYETANHGSMDWQDHWCLVGMIETSQHISGYFPSGPRKGQPMRGRSKVGFTYFGTFFWPLVVLDKIVWHPTHESDVAKSN